MLTRRLSFSNWSMLSCRTRPPSAPVESSPAATSTARWCSRTSGVAYSVPLGDLPSPEKGDLDRSVGDELAERMAKALLLAAEGLSPRRRLAMAATTGEDAMGTGSAIRATGMLMGALTGGTPGGKKKVSNKVHVEAYIACLHTNGTHLAA